MIGASSRSRPGRRGFLLLEAAAAGLMVAIAMALAVQALGWVAVERRAAERRQRAVQEVANALERLAARPWEALTPGAVRDVATSTRARQALPGAEWTATVADEGDGLKRIAVALRWRDRAGRFEAPVRLTAWVARRGRARR